MLRLGKRVILSNAQAELGLTVSGPPRTVNVQTEVPVFSKVHSASFSSNQIVAWFSWDTETPPDETEQRSLAIVVADGTVPDGNYEHVSTFPAINAHTVHVFQLVPSQPQS